MGLGGGGWHKFLRRLMPWRWFGVVKHAMVYYRQLLVLGGAELALIA